MSRARAPSAVSEHYLQGKVAAVTGGNGGIGRAIVDAFAAEGAQVMSCGRRPRPGDLPDTIHWQTANIADTTAVENLKQEVIDTFGTLSILVNNAGVQIEKTILQTSDADWDKLMGVNAKGVFLTCRALIPIMSNGASIINIGSMMRRPSWRRRPPD